MKLSALLCAVATLCAAEERIALPRLQQAPALEDFLEMKPSPAMDGLLKKVEGFRQRVPKDGQPVTERTEAYLGYDNKNLYAIFLCFDSAPEKIRARMARRENFVGDDTVVLFLDTFHDRRRAYLFLVNPFGIQSDALYTEGQGSDVSFDTLWHSRGRLTAQGYVVWMAIPFKSLRFPAVPGASLSFGVLLGRKIPRNNEEAFWPQVSTRIEGLLSQSGAMEGLTNISPGRNVQLIPYVFSRTYRELDSRVPARPVFARSRADIQGGLDAKVVLKDSLAVDATVNPDFSQIESDEPQVTLNERFEVFFPEKRPFFLENSGYFQTPINLIFTRRIVDPQYGVRLSGKTGPYAIGAMFVDDQSPDPRHGTAARFGIFRLNRDISKQSTVGVIFTDREFQGGYNRVGGADARFKLNDHWVTSFQAVASSTTNPEGNHQSGPAYQAEVTRTGRQFSYFAVYRDLSPGFFTAAGFEPRTDIREVDQRVQYDFRPEGRRLISWGPVLYTSNIWDHQGMLLNWLYSPGLQWEFIRQTTLSLSYTLEREVFSRYESFRHNTYNVSGATSYWRWITLAASYSRGQRVNLYPLFLAHRDSLNLTMTLRPVSPLRIDNTYLLNRLTARGSGASIFNNHILRSKWNWQFNKELSVRAILQYNAVLANPASKNFNGDFLVTYLLNPGTALYMGYNSNLQNLDDNFRPIPNHFINDSRQFFVKLSYLLRF